MQTDHMNEFLLRISAILLFQNILFASMLKYWNKITNIWVLKNWGLIIWMFFAFLRFVLQK